MEGIDQGHSTYVNTLVSIFLWLCEEKWAIDPGGSSMITLCRIYMKHKLINMRVCYFNQTLLDDVTNILCQLIRELG